MKSTQFLKSIQKTHTPSYEGFLNAIHPEDRALVNDAYAYSVENQTFYDYTHRLLMSDGRVKYVREQGETFYDTNGTPIESRGTVHDITDQKELENTLREKNSALVEISDRLELATQAAKIGIWVWNISDNSLIWNKHMFDIFELDEKARNRPIVYEDWSSSVHPDDIQRAEHELTDAVNGNKSFETVFKIIVPGGKVKHIHAAAILHYDENKIANYMVGINRDITAEKTLEENLTLAKEAAENCQ